MAVKLRAKTDLLGVQHRLEALNLELGREVEKLRRRAAELIVPKARAHVPITHYPTRRGHLAASLAAGSGQVRSGGSGFGVISRVPQGGVHEFGGTIAPRGYPIRIRPSRMATLGGEESLPQVDELLREGVDDLLRRYF